MVAMISGVVSFLIIFAHNDCQPMRAEPSSYPVQVHIYIYISDVLVHLFLCRVLHDLSADFLCMLVI